MKQDDEGGVPTDNQPAMIAAVVTYGDRVLLVSTEVADDTWVWAFPVGAQQPGETPGQASGRVVAAAAGLAIVTGEVICERINPQNGRHMVYVAGQPRGGQASPADLQSPGLAWCTLAEFDAKVPPGVYPPVRDHLRQVLDR